MTDLRCSCRADFEVAGCPEMKTSSMRPISIALEITALRHRQFSPLLVCVGAVEEHVDALKLFLTYGLPRIIVPAFQSGKDSLVAQILLLLLA